MSPEMILGLLEQYGYVFIFFVAPFMGPIISLGSGVLIKLEVFTLFPVAATLMASELCADVLWYWLGIKWGDSFVNRFGHYVGITRERVEGTKRLYNRYHDIIIFISKITAGFGIAPVIFFTAGLSRVPFGRYMLMNIFGQVLWTSAMLAIGYYLGHVYLSVNNWLDRSFYIVVILAAIAFLMGISKYLYEKFIPSTSL